MLNTKQKLLLIVKVSPWAKLLLVDRRSRAFCFVLFCPPFLIFKCTLLHPVVWRSVVLFWLVPPTVTCEEEEKEEDY